ncbi:hypothetical protein TWF481_006377 [Arthrobotrys musiformis]|uniref:F-box domain-containing protein n=1 Tax=Arthrobotrys musiformis TaxID=47236 RepID=A0AAV9WGK4_9PEZI
MHIKGLHCIGRHRLDGMTSWPVSTGRMEHQASLTGLPFELLSAIASHLPPDSFISLLQTSKRIYNTLHPIYLKKFTTYLLYPTKNCLNAFAKKINNSPFYGTHLKHLRVSLRCPQFSKTQIQWLYGEYMRGRVCSDGLLPNLQPLLAPLPAGMVGQQENCKLVTSTTTLITILNALKSLETLEFVNSLDPIPLEDCIYDNHLGKFKPEELERARKAAGSPFFLDDFAVHTVVPWVFGALYATDVRLREVVWGVSPLVDEVKWVLQSRGVPVPKFSGEDYAITGYRRVFGGLKTLEMKVASLVQSTGGVDGDQYPPPPSAWFESFAGGLENLMLSHEDDSRFYIRQNLPRDMFLAYPLRITAVIPGLTKLKLRRCELRFDPLAGFLEGNAGSLRRLILEENEYYEPFGYTLDSTKDHGDSFKAYTHKAWVGFFNMLSASLKLDYFSIDIPGNPATEFRTELIYFSIKGKWGGPTTMCEITHNGQVLAMNVEGCLEFVSGVLRDAVEEYKNWELRTEAWSRSPRYQRMF